MRLSEIGMGAFSGRLLWELQAQHLGALSRAVSRAVPWLVFSGAGSETFEAMRERVVAFLDEREGPAVIVCHGTTARMLRGVALGLDRAATLALPVGQGVVWSVADGVHEGLGA